jgi:hypothetical protein
MSPKHAKVDTLIHGSLLLSIPLRAVLLIVVASIPFGKPVSDLLSEGQEYL